MGFQFLGFLAAAKNFLVAADRYCLSNTECTRCSEKESRCSGDNIPSPLLARLAATSNFLAVAVVQGLPPKFQTFFLTLGGNLVATKVIFAAVEWDLVTTSRLCLSFFVVSRCSGSVPCCSESSLPLNAKFFLGT